MHCLFPDCLFVCLQVTEFCWVRVGPCAHKTCFCPCGAPVAIMTLRHRIKRPGHLQSPLVPVEPGIAEGAIHGVKVGTTVLTPHPHLQYALSPLVDATEFSGLMMSSHTWVGQRTYSVHHLLLTPDSTAKECFLVFGIWAW